MTVPIDISKIDIITDKDINDLLKEIEQQDSQDKITRSQMIYNAYNDINGEVATDNNPYCDTYYGKIHLYELYTVLNDILVE